MRFAPLLAALALCAGCGGGEDSSPGTGDSPPRSPRVVAALGDSITAGVPGYHPTPPDLGFGSIERSQWEYWAERANPGIDLRNCGVTAETTDEIATRLSDCVEEAGAGAIVIQGGTNDLGLRTPPEAVAANLREMVRMAKEMGLAVAIADVLPVNPSVDELSAEIAELNRLIEQIAEAEGIPVLPFHDTLEHPSGSGRMPARWTADGIHPTIKGYRRLGERAYRAPR